MFNDYSVLPIGIIFFHILQNEYLCLVCDLNFICSIHDPFILNNHLRYEMWSFHELLYVIYTLNVETVYGTQWLTH